MPKGLGVAHSQPFFSRHCLSHKHGQGGFGEWVSIIALLHHLGLYFVYPPFPPGLVYGLVRVTVVTGSATGIGAFATGEE